ncbi:tail assembly chaperone [Clavibacter phage CN1A]|uniref:Tail assembly chaperone n=1 Tax=Clavibacter phage CN1A TaxID=1406793 RepID=U5PX36_9CAUD|nr:tail assembly chaperone [Clavibacter phage CN1A]AGY47152.1 hypothetical protein CN1A_43 [Clavibacter phage CN1A]
MTDTKSIEELVASVSDPATTSFLDLLHQRAYAKAKVDVYLDEALGHRVVQLRKQRDELTGKLDAGGDSDEVVNALAAIEDALAQLADQLKKTKLTVHLTGISEGARLNIQDQLEALFPTEYDVDVSPYTGATQRTPKPNPKRDRFGGYLVWRESIEQIEGSGIEGKLTVADVAAFRQNIPAASQVALMEKIEELRVATQWTDIVQDDDFFPSA